MLLEIKGKPCVPLEIGQLYLLGTQIIGDKRKSKNFIEFEEEEDVSQRHCAIEINHNAEAFVLDLFSLKGTLLNNKILNNLQKTRLNNGDILKIGKIEIKFDHDKKDVFHDSSGFLEVNKNKSGTSPDSTSQLEITADFLVPSVPQKLLDALSSTLSTSNRRSDSFTIPETQYCRPRSSLNGSNLSIAESVPDDNVGKVKFSFGSLNSFEGDDDLCIPETQEVLQTGRISEVCKRGEENSITKVTVDGSQFRICTQDYNEGFGEEEGVQHLHSQIIPLIMHPTVNLNNSKSSNENLINQSNIGQDEEQMSALKWSKSNVDKETTELRADCPTPDIFDFERNDKVNKKPEDTETNENIDQTSAGRDTNLLEEDEEDFLLTQVLPACPLVTKVVKNKSLNERETACFEIEQEQVITLSDKENMCPVSKDAIAELPSTQLFEVPAARSQVYISCRQNISSSIKPNMISGIENSTNSILNATNDEEDDLLTQALLQPPSNTITSTDSSTNKLPNNCLNSTLLEDKVMVKNPATFFAEIEKTPLKQTCSSGAVFKMPEKDISISKRTSSATSATSENDLDLLMCTPQFIKDNMFLGRTEELKNNILAVKNRNLFGDETEEDDDDDQSDLVKLINVPKDSLDFDKLLPHLNTKPEHTKMSEKEKETKEAQKIYKFSVSFGKEQDEKHANTKVPKSSTLSRDERHAARDKVISEGKRELKEKSCRQDRYRTVSRKKEKEVVRREKEIERNENEKIRNEKEEVRKEKEKIHKKEESSKDKKESNNRKKKEAKPPLPTPDNVQETITNKQVKNTRNRHSSSDKSEKKQESELDNNGKKMPARRMTRSKSRLFETAPTDNDKEDLDSISTQPIVMVTRNRTKSELNESEDSRTSNSSSHKNMPHRNRNCTENNDSPNVNAMVEKYERKRKTDAPSVVPAKVERKNLRSSESSISSTHIVSISTTMVDQEMVKKLFKDSNGSWNIATNCVDSEILVMDRSYRTFKFLLAMARGIPIVTSDYLKKLNESKSAKEVRINNYLFTDKEFEKKYNFSMLKSLQAAKEHKIFKGYEFLMTSSILPNPQEIKTIIEASGGYVYDKTPPQAKENERIYLVTAKEDKKDWHKYRRLNKNIVIISTEAIMSTVMSQKIQMNSFRLA